MERKGFIGGSDCVKIMQGEWLKLWQIKTGRVESDDLSDNIAVQLAFTLRTSTSAGSRSNTTACCLTTNRNTKR